ncbi:non-homologous end-joining DNA ligase [Marinicauda salina]|nr:non-homologous end-joining DNA ligase [Marinicauda salina]
MSRGRRPAFAKPVLCKLVDEAPAGEDWIHETKYDGYRLLAAVGGGKATLYTRNEKDWSDRFPGLIEALEKLDASGALIDGEAVVIGETGLSDFAALQNAMSEGDSAVVYYAFDLLKLEGEDLRDAPLLERKKKLKALLGDAGDPIRYAGHVRGGGEQAYEKACDEGAEGVVSKKADSAYVAGRGGEWVKTKCSLREEAVVVGWSPSDKASRKFSSLILATCEDGEWVYRGRVGTGFDEAEQEELIGEMKRIERKTSPLDTDAPRSVTHDARWITPKLVVEVEYTERTRDGLFRHPVYIAMREDKAAEQVSAEPVKSGGKA